MTLLKDKQKLQVLQLQMRCAIVAMWFQSSSNVELQSCISFEECRLLGRGAMWFYYKPTFRRNIHLQGLRGTASTNCSQSVSYRLTLFLAHFISSTLKMEATHSSETWFIGILHSHHHENLKSYFFFNPLLFASCTDTVKLLEAWRGVLSSTPPYK
jgi:hypothetical protein